MFENEADWKSATKLICDLLQGSGSLAVERHSSAIVDGERRHDVSSWQYSQKHAHGKGQAFYPRLFTLDQLEDTLRRMSEADVDFAYETSGFERFSDSIEGRLLDFSTIKATLVQLVIGDVRMSGTLIGLSNPRDLILWKMQYHLRDVQL